MQYNSHATNQDLVTLAEKLSKSDSVSFPIAEKTLYANQAGRIIQSWIHESYGGWGYDDGNFTTLPQATTNLVSGQTNYNVPTDTSYIKGVEYKLTSSGVWYKMSPVTLEQIQGQGSETQFLSVSSSPLYYRLIGGSIIIYPPANVNVTDGLKVYYTRDISYFATTDTTKVPGFDTAFHEAIAVYMALMYAKINSLPVVNFLEIEWARYEKMIKESFSRRFAENFPANMHVADYVMDNI
jgi:hypothetical protein